MDEEKKRTKKPKSKARKIIEWVLTGLFLALFAIVGIAQIDGMVHKKDHYNQLIRFGYSNYVVQTDSMEPKYKVKTAIITYLDDVDKIYANYIKDKSKEIDVTFMYVQTAETEYTVPQEHPELTNRTNRPGASDPAFGYPMTHQVKEIHMNPNAKKGEGKYTFITAGINTRSTNMGWQEGNPDLVINQYQAFTEKELLGVVIANSAFLGGVFSFVASPFGLLALLLIPAFYLVITSVIDIFKAYKEPEEENASSLKENKGTLDLSEEDKKRLKEELLEEMLNKKKGGE